jgi:exopolyphosphatase / guanosine-5'-triphosphate,3'-diphosphate pyrophosphatase
VPPIVSAPVVAVAAVDCGTNSTRLLVEGPGGDERARLMRITRLGQGVDATRRLDPAAVDRTLQVLREYRAVMDAEQVAKARMAATSAVRDAENGRQFLEAAGDVLGVAPELLAGTEEGALAYAGAISDLSPGAGHVVVVDIGGGSTELIAGAGTGPPAGVVSLDIGCVRLTERFLRHDPPTAGEVHDAHREIGSQLEMAAEAVPVLDLLPPGSRLVGLAGTVSTLSMLDQGLLRYEWGRVHHAVLARDVVTRWAVTLAAEPATDRARRPGMVPGREDVILGGVLVLEAVMGRFGFDRCLVSERDILDGLAASLHPGAAPPRGPCSPGPWR